MSYLKQQIGNLKFDKRLLEINLKNGTLTKEEYDKYLAQLEDMEGQSEAMTLDEKPSSNGSLPPSLEDTPMDSGVASGTATDDYSTSGFQ